MRIVAKKIFVEDYPVVVFDLPLLAPAALIAGAAACFSKSGPRLQAVIPLVETAALAALVIAVGCAVMAAAQGL